MSALQDRIDILQKEIESFKVYIKLKQEPILCNHPAISFEVYPDDLGEMNWEDAMKACADLGDGWRLPTKDELNVLYENKDKIGGFSPSVYWSSTEGKISSFAWIQKMRRGGGAYGNGTKDYNYYVRAVRTF